MVKHIQTIRGQQPSFPDLLNSSASFPNLLKRAPSDVKHENVSNEVESLFTSIPIQETIDYFLCKIYVKRELKPFCKFKKLFNF